MNVSTERRVETCPHEHHMLFEIVTNGIEIKCKWCKQKHFIGRSHFEQAWNELALANRDPEPLRVVHA